jgi:hypothetical protein
MPLDFPLFDVGRLYTLPIIGTDPTGVGKGGGRRSSRSVGEAVSRSFQDGIMDIRFNLHENGNAKTLLQSL